MKARMKQNEATVRMESLITELCRVFGSVKC